MLIKRKIVISIIMLGLFLRITFIFLHPYPDINDAYQYDLIATNIMNGYGISQETKPPYTPQIDRVPFYPIFMAFIYFIFGHHLIAIRIVQTVLSMITAFLVYLIAKAIIKKNDTLSTLPIVSFVLTLLCPFLILFVSILFAETLTAFLITLSLLLFLYGIYENKLIFYFFSGISIGLAFMTRPEVFAFPIILAATHLFINLHKITVRRIATYLLPFFLIWSIWIARNYFAFNKFIPITAQAGTGLLVGTYPPNRYIKDFPKEVAEEYSKVRFIPEEERVDVVLDMKRRAFQRILEHPLQYMGYCIQRIPILWISSYTHYIGIDDTLSNIFNDIKIKIKEHKSFFREGWLVLIKVTLYLFNIFSVVLGILGMFLLGKKITYTYPLYITVIYFTLVHIPLGLASPRYVIKILPIFLIFSSVGVAYLYYWFKRHSLN